jgi:N-acetyl-anhydromuramyl-L-alanine amidase AmpD
MQIPGLVVDNRTHSHVLQSPLAAPRRGIMLHYDDSSRDDWAVAWFHDARCTNGYTWLVLDDGTIVELADPAMRTPHAGACNTPMANSAYYGIAAATNGLVPATEAQIASIVNICQRVFLHHGWPMDTAPDRLVGHDAQAIWTPDYTTNRELWGQLGRKVDPTGQRPDGIKIIDVAHIARRLDKPINQPINQQSK